MPMKTVKQAMEFMRRKNYELYYFSKYNFHWHTTGTYQDCMKFAARLEEQGLWWRIVKVEREIISDDLIEI